MYYVYTWTRLDTNEVFYVGKGHKNRYKDMSMRNRYFLNVVNKVGKDNIRIDIIKNNLTEPDAFSWEKYYIKYYKEQGHHLTNMTEGGEGSSDWYNHLTEEEKAHHREISKSFLGKYHTEATKKKMSESAKGRKMKEESKQKLSKAHSKGVYVVVDNTIIETYNSVLECQAHYASLGEHSLSKSCIQTALNNDGFIQSKYKKHQIHLNKQFVYQEDYHKLFPSTIETRTHNEMCGRME